MEYANVNLECNAADERAKLLASEVIGLEEKVIKCSIPVCWAKQFHRNVYTKIILSGMLWV